MRSSSSLLMTALREGGLCTRSWLLLSEELRDVVDRLTKIELPHLQGWQLRLAHRSDDPDCVHGVSSERKEVVVHSAANTEHFVPDPLQLSLDAVFQRLLSFIGPGFACRTGRSARRP